MSGLPTEPSRAPKRAKVIPNGFSDGNIRPAPPQPAKNAPPTDKMAVERSSSDRRNDSPHAKSAPAAKPRKAPEAARRTPILPPTDIAPSSRAPPAPAPANGDGSGGIPKKVVVFRNLCTDIASGICKIQINTVI